MMQTVTDFGRSFVLGSGSTTGGGNDHNDPRFWVESVLRIHDNDSAAPIVYHQCGSCKAENTFDARDLFKEDNYDFLPAFGQGRLVVFRHTAFVGAMPYKRVIPWEGHPWGQIEPRIVEVQATRLQSFEAIVEATRRCFPIVGRTTITNHRSGLRAEMEYPIKTMNIRHRPEIYQIDTGPVLLPDLSRRQECWGDALRLAFIAFNSPDRTAFVVEAPVPVPNGGGQIMHYSRIEEIDAHNSLWAAGTLS